MEYLGHNLTPVGIRPDPKKIRAIEEYLTPKTLGEIQAFIELAVYYRRHVQNYSKFAKLLTHFTKKDVLFEWTKENQGAFNALRKN